jgi:hypothetical protein
MEYKNIWSADYVEGQINIKAIVSAKEAEKLVSNFAEAISNLKPSKEDKVYKLFCEKAYCPFCHHCVLEHWEIGCKIGYQEHPKQNPCHCTAPMSKLYEIFKNGYETEETLNSTRSNMQKRINYEDSVITNLQNKLQAKNDLIRRNSLYTEERKKEIAYLSVFVLDVEEEINSKDSIHRIMNIEKALFRLQGKLSELPTSKYGFIKRHEGFKTFEDCGCDWCKKIVARESYKKYVKARSPFISDMIKDGRL